MIAGILGASGCGGTFLDWSIHYLSGAQTHWVMRSNNLARETNPDFFTNSKLWKTYARLVDIPDNPLLNNTAHSHGKTHPSTDALPLVIDEFKKQPQDQLHTFYYMDSMRDDQTATIHNQLIEQYPEIKFITYTYSPTSIDAIFYLQLEKLPDIIKNYGADIVNAPIWTQRELLSLRYQQAIKGQTINETIAPHSNSLELRFDDFYISLHTKIFEILTFLELPVDPGRFAQWRQMYAQWQENSGVRFYADLNIIVNAIVNGHSLSLAEYNMTLAKEVVVANRLLYNYNLVLKAEGLEQLGNNTQEWHNLLEENVYHNVKE
jgi:hypothetical protein